VKKRIIFSVFTIVVAAAVIAGGTMAWFTNKTETTDAVFTAGTVSIEAGETIDFDEEDDYYDWYNEDEVKPLRVVDYKWIQPIQEARTNPNAVLELETERSDSNFFSLGFGGYVTVEFDGILVPGETKIIVYEETWKPSVTYPRESAIVSLSMDGENWVTIEDELHNQKDHNKDQKKNVITIPEDFELEYARYIKIEDTSNQDDFVGIENADGFDVNYICIKGYYRDKNMNWNPGDISKKTFKIVNTGTKDIHLRGKFSGSWYEYDTSAHRWKEWTPNPDEGVVTISLNDPDWMEKDGWYYYTGSIDGTYPDKEPASVTLDIEVKLDGKDTGNQYQGKRYILKGSFEAIQASNGASKAAKWAYIPGSETQE
jgi:predicted ribosomally synthesized peptide with SipW-like signal peptide